MDFLEETRLASMATWLPPLLASGVKVPRTTLVESPPLECLLDGEKTPEIDAFFERLKTAMMEYELPCFLRTGWTSGKHYYKKTCFVGAPGLYMRHVAQLVEFSACAGIIGLPTTLWAVREFIPLRHYFTAFDGLPIAREFRYFIRDGAVVCRHPYWPPDAVAQGRPPRGHWDLDLDHLQTLATSEESFLHALAILVARKFSGAWSLDFAQATNGDWYAIDMAPAGASFHWDGCPHAAEFVR